MIDGRSSHAKPHRFDLRDNFAALKNSEIALECSQFGGEGSAEPFYRAARSYPVGNRKTRLKQIPFPDRSRFSLASLPHIALTINATLRYPAVSQPLHLIFLFTPLSQFAPLHFGLHHF